MKGPDRCPTWLDHVTNKSSTLLRNFVRTRWKSILREQSLTAGGGGRLVIFFFFGGGATIFWAPISGGLKFSEPAFRGGLQFSGSLWAMCGYYWVLCYWNFKYCLKYDGRASNINRIAYSKLNRTVKKHSDWLEMRSDFTWNSLQFAWLWNGFENSARELWITRLRTESSTK